MLGHAPSRPSPMLRSRALLRCSHWGVFPRRPDERQPPTGQEPEQPFSQGLTEGLRRVRTPVPALDQGRQVLLRAVPLRVLVTTHAVAPTAEVRTDREFGASKGHSGRSTSSAR